MMSRLGDENWDSTCDWNWEKSAGTGFSARNLTGRIMSIPACADGMVANEDHSSNGATKEEKPHALRLLLRSRRKETTCI